MEIGFQLNVFDFVPIIRSVTIDAESFQVFSTHVKIESVIETRQIGKIAYTFRRGPVFRDLLININEIYRRDYQRDRFIQIFNDLIIVDKYWSSIGENLLKIFIISLIYVYLTIVT